MNKKLIKIISKSNLKIYKPINSKIGTYFEVDYFENMLSFS